MCDKMHEIRAIKISNDLYRSYTFSAFKMSKEFMKPLGKNQKPVSVDRELRIAHNELITK